MLRRKGETSGPRHLLENWAEISALASHVTLGKSCNLPELLYKGDPISATLGNLLGSLGYRLSLIVVCVISA